MVHCGRLGNPRDQLAQLGELVARVHHLLVARQVRGSPLMRGPYDGAATPVQVSELVGPICHGVVGRCHGVVVAVGHVVHHRGGAYRSLGPKLHLPRSVCEKGILL